MLVLVGLSAWVGPPVSLITHLCIVKNLLCLNDATYIPQLINFAVVVVVTGGDFFLYYSLLYCTEGVSPICFSSWPCLCSHYMICLCALPPFLD